VVNEALAELLFAAARGVVEQGVTYPPTYDLPPPVIATLGPLSAALLRDEPDQQAARRCVEALEALPPSKVDSVYSALGVWVSMLEWVDAPLPKRRRNMFGWPVGAPVDTATWRPRQPNRSKALSQLKRIPGLDVIFLFCPDGYIREAALKQLVSTRSAFVLTAVAYRLNDWVGPVRLAAQACAMRVFASAPVDAVAEAALFLTQRKSFWRRGEAEIALLDEAFARPDVVEALAGLILSGRSGLVSRAFSHVLARDLLDHRLVEFATRAENPAVRVIAARTLIEGKASRRIGYDRQWIDKTYNLSRRVPRFASRPIHRPQPVEALIALTAHDRSAAVRRVAAEGLVRLRRDIETPGLLLAMLKDDRSASIRRRIQFVADDLGLELSPASRSKGA